MPTTAAVGAGIGAIGSIGAAAIGASAQTSAAQQAAATEQAMYQEGLKEVQPYVSAGSNSENWYNYLTGTGTLPGSTPTATNPLTGAGAAAGQGGIAGAIGNAISNSAGGNSANGVNTTGLPTSYNPLTAPLTTPFTAATLPSTPGYQFTLDQGLKSTQNSYAAQGLGSSGAAEKGAAAYATGQASTTYNSQLQNYLTQNAQIANLLYQPVQTGSQAAGAALGGAVQTGSNVGSAEIGAGNAVAGAATGAANSLTGGVNTALQYSLLNQYLTNQGAASFSGNVNSYLSGAEATNNTIGNFIDQNGGGGGVPYLAGSNLFTGG